MINCAEHVQVQNIKHMHIRHPKQRVSKQLCSNIQLSSKMSKKKKKKKGGGGGGGGGGGAVRRRKTTGDHELLLQPNARTVPSPGHGPRPALTHGL